MSLPVVQSDDDGLGVVDPDTGEIAPVRDASDRALANAAARIRELDQSLYQMKQTIAVELCERHGVGTVNTGGYAFKVAQSQSWPAGSTQAALDALQRRGVLTGGDVDRALPSKPRPDSRALKALIGRLTVSDPEAARLLADVCTVSAPSIRDVRLVAVDEDCG